MIELNDDDVVSMDISGFVASPTFKITELKSKIREFANQENKGTPYLNTKVQWFSSEGLKCEVLSTQGGGWRKGRLRFCLEFIPDEPAKAQPLKDPNSPLDDLRSKLDT